MDGQTYRYKMSSTPLGPSPPQSQLQISEFLFPVALIKCSCKSNLKEKRFVLPHNSREQSVTVGRSEWQEHWVTSHLLAVEVKGMLSSLALPSTIQHPISGDGYHPYRVAFHTPLNLSKIVTHRRYLSPVPGDSNPVKLTVNTCTN